MTMNDDLHKLHQAWTALTQAVWAERVSLFMWLGAVWVLMLAFFAAIRLL